MALERRFKQLVERSRASEERQHVEEGKPKKQSFSTEWNRTHYYMSKIVKILLFLHRNLEKVNFSPITAQRFLGSIKISNYQRPS